MHINKIVSFSVVILLITVSLASVAAAQSDPTPTKLSAAAAASQFETLSINGTLNTTDGTPIAGATI